MKSLVKRAQRGDDQAFVELIEENKQAMYKIAVGILKNDFDAADAIQESILTCYEKLRELKKAQYFKTWLLRILINESRRKDCSTTGSSNNQRRLSRAVRPDGTAISGCIDFILCRRDEHPRNQSNTADE